MKHVTGFPGYQFFLFSEFIRLKKEIISWKEKKKEIIETENNFASKTWTCFFFFFFFLFFLRKEFNFLNDSSK